MIYTSKQYNSTEIKKIQSRAHYAPELAWVITDCGGKNHNHDTLKTVKRAAQTVLGVYLERTCSRVTSASSALAVLNDYALYKSTHSLTHSLKCSLQSHCTSASRVRTKHKQVRVQLPTYADNVTLPAFAAERRPCSSRPTSLGRRAHSSKPAATAAWGRRTGHMHGPCSAYYAGKKVKVAHTRLLSVGFRS